MSPIEIRPLNDEELAAARRFVNRNADRLAAPMLKRLPQFFDMAETLVPVEAYRSQLRFALGAFSGGALVGTVALGQAGAPTNASPDGLKLFLADFSHRERAVFGGLAKVYAQAFIGAPQGSLSIHSLAVDGQHRRRGIAKQMLWDVIRRVEGHESASLYMEIARVKWHERLCEQLGFRAVRKTFSLPMRIEFGCWGTILMKYGAHAAG